MLHILTLNYNGQSKLEKLAPSLINSLNDIDYTWHIRDNASKDNSVDYLKTLDNKNINIIQYKNNIQNFSQGMNYIFKEAASKDDDYVLLLNNDIIFNDKTSIKNMINIMDNDNTVGAVGGRLLYTNTNNIQHCGVVFDNWNGLPVHLKRGIKSDANAEKNRYFQAVTGAVLLTKAKYYANICEDNKSGMKGLDENFSWAFDDVDMCLSIKYNMLKNIVYCGKTNISHEESATLKVNPINRLFQANNINHLRNKWGSRIKQDLSLYTKNSNYNLYKDEK